MIKFDKLSFLHMLTLFIQWWNFNSFKIVVIACKHYDWKLMVVCIR